MSKMRTLICGAVILAMPLAASAVPFADTVVSFTGGSGYGVTDQSGGSYSGASGAGVYDPLAITGGLDGAALGLGGETGTPGVIVVIDPA